jgi:hypothetical protein
VTGVHHVGVQYSCDSRTAAMPPRRLRSANSRSRKPSPGLDQCLFCFPFQPQLADLLEERIDKLRLPSEHPRVEHQHHAVMVALKLLPDHVQYGGFALPHGPNSATTRSSSTVSLTRAVTS